MIFSDEILSRILLEQCKTDQGSFVAIEGWLKVNLGHTLLRRVDAVMSYLRKGFSAIP